MLLHVQSALGNAQAVHDNLLCEAMEMRYNKKKPELNQITISLNFVQQTYPT